MLKQTEIELLMSPRLRDLIRENINADPLRIAMKLSENGAIVATQIKYLRRAKTKLPSYYAAQCIIPPLAFEQCSSEAAATTKEQTGSVAIDLTCGLGVDTLALAKRFKRVITIEKNEALTAIARYNFGVLGADNIEVINSSAEEFINRLMRRSGGEAVVHNYDKSTTENGSERSNYSTENDNSQNSCAIESNREQSNFSTQGSSDNTASITLPVDLIYIDPARRSESGSKLFLLEDCSPNVIELMPRLLYLARKIIIKASPLFDIEEAFRIFGHDITVEIVSVSGECKEVVIEVNSPFSERNRTPEIASNTNCIQLHYPKITEESNQNYSQDDRHSLLQGVIRVRRIPGSTLSFSRRITTVDSSCKTPFSPPYKFLLVPDVTIYKARLLERYFKSINNNIFITSSIGYGLCNTNCDDFFGQCYPIESIHPYHPKKLKPILKNLGISRADILKKDCPLDSAQVARALGIKEGGNRRLAITRIENALYLIILT